MPPKRSGPEAPSDADQLTTADVARLTGLSSATIWQYRSRGRMPAEDGRHAGRIPWWHRSTITDWQATRQKGAGRPRKSASS